MKSLKELKCYLENESFDLEHEAAMVQSRILSPIIAEIEDNGIKQEDLAKATGLTQPFLSALFNIRKKLSMKHIAVLQEALGIVLQTPSALSKERHELKFYSGSEYEGDSEPTTLFVRGIDCQNLFCIEYTNNETTEEYKWAARTSLKKRLDRGARREKEEFTLYRTEYIQ